MFILAFYILGDFFEPPVVVQENLYGKFQLKSTAQDYLNNADIQLQS